MASNPLVPQDHVPLGKTIREEAPKTVVQVLVTAGVGAVLSASQTAMGASAWPAVAGVLLGSAGMWVTNFGFAQAELSRRRRELALVDPGWALHFRLARCQGNASGSWTTTLEVTNASEARWRLSHGRMDMARLGSAAIQAPLLMLGVLPGETSIEPHTTAQLHFEGPCPKVADEGRWTAVFLGESLYSGNPTPAGYLVVRGLDDVERTVPIPALQGFVATSQLPKLP